MPPLTLPPKVDFVDSVDSIASPPPAVVLDTNVVLDWMLFADPVVSVIREAIASGAVRWIATTAMRDELEHVLDRGGFDRWAPDRAAIRAQWEGRCAGWPHPLPPDATAHYACTDPDDQKFIDLALAGHARWLVTRDRALLRLATRLRVHGIAVVRPGDWRPTG